MTPKLAGLSTALATLRDSLEGQAAALVDRADAANTRMKAAMAKATSQMAATEQAVADIEAFANSLEGSNGGPSLSDSSDTSAVAQLVTSVSPLQEPERLSINGVAQG